MTEYQQGGFTFGLEWQDICETCGKPALGHSHGSPDLEMIVRELKKAQAPEPVGEHLTKKELARYSKRSTKWLLARTKDPVDPLPCERPSAGKVTFSRAAYDKWIGRQRPDAIVGAVDRAMIRLGGKP